MSKTGMKKTCVPEGNRKVPGSKSGRNFFRGTFEEHLGTCGNVWERLNANQTSENVTRNPGREQEGSFREGAW